MAARNTSRGAGNQRDRAAAGNGQAPAAVAGIPVTIVTEAVADDGDEHGTQAAIEGVVRVATVEFFGETFALKPKVSYLPMLKFAHYATKGTDSASMQGMAAMYEMLRSCFERGRACGVCDVCVGDPDGDPPRKPALRDCESRIGDEWPRFEEHAIDSCADDEDLFAVVTQVLESASARPTRPPSGSARPAPSTSANSKGRSRLPAGAEQLTPIDHLAR